MIRMCVCVCTYVCACAWVCVCVCTYTCGHHACTHTVLITLHANTHIATGLLACMHAFIYRHAFIHMCTYISCTLCLIARLCLQSLLHLHRLWVKVTGYIAVMMAINHVIACCWYGVGYYTSDQGNWLQRSNIDAESFPDARPV